MFTESLDSGLMMIFLIALLPIIGLIMAITPYLMKKSECFTVTVPEAAAHDPYLKSLKKVYASVMLIITLVVTAVAFLMLVLNSEMGVLISMLLGTLIICVVGYGLMLYFRKKVSLYKKEQHWEARKQESVAVVGEADIPHALSLKWSWLYVPPILIAFLVGYFGYEQMPEMIVMNVGLEGQANSIVAKTPFIIGMAPLIQAFLAGCFIFSHWTILRSKRLSEPEAPVASALAYGLFAHAQSLFLLISGLLITTSIILMPINFMGIISLMQSALIIMAIALLIVVGAIVLSIIYGQGGSRVFTRMTSSQTLLADDDSFWKLGIFYWNPDDPNWFLPARFGIGWTCNFARPGVWVMGIVGSLITVAFVVAIMLLV